MSAFGGLLFAAAGFVALVSAVATVMLRSPLRAAVGLLTHIIALAVLYLTLHAHLLAALQLIVYAGAVVVLFVFVIMLLGPQAAAQGTTRGLLTRTVSALGMGIVASAIAFSVVTLDPPKERADVHVCVDPTTAECGQFGGVKAFGTVLFRQAGLPFEIVSALLLVAILGAIGVAQGRTAAEAQAALAKRKAAEAEKLRKLEEERRLAAEVSAHGGH